MAENSGSSSSNTSGSGSSSNSGIGFNPFVNASHTDAERHYFGKDHLGSVRAVTNQWGSPLYMFDYDVFGQPLQDRPERFRHGFTGKEYDSWTGLYNYGFRDYSATFGRFTTVDPIQDGLNWYAYVNSDPVSWLDPWGLCPQDAQSGEDPDRETDIEYTLDNPINQEDFDARYGFSSPKGTQSCKTNSLINIYAADGGVTQSVLDSTVEQWRTEGVIANDGSPKDLNAMSKTLAEELGRTDYYSLVYPAPAYNKLEYKSQTEFEQSEYQAGIQTRTKQGYTHYTATIKTSGLTGETNTQTLDSLDPDRPGAEDYSVTNIEPFQVLNLKRSE